MATFQTIAVPQSCPSCGQQDGITCQAHVHYLYGENSASVFESGPYQIGEAMRWSAAKAPPKCFRWFDQIRGMTAIECCYANCNFCGAELFVVLKFLESTPKEVLEVGLAKDWPLEFSK